VGKLVSSSAAECAFVVAGISGLNMKGKMRRDICSPERRQVACWTVAKVEISESSH